MLERTRFNSKPIGKLDDVAVFTVTNVTLRGWYLIDYIYVAPSAAPAPHKVVTSLVAPSPLPVVQALYNKLLSKYGSGEIFSGQAETAGVKWLETNVGKTPAIIGLDLMDYSPSRIVSASRHLLGVILTENRSMEWHLPSQ